MSGVITFSVVPAIEGLEWLRVSVRIFRSQWLRYTSIAALFLLIMLTAVYLSVVSGGLPFAVLLKPVLSIGFLAAAWHHERGELPEARHLLAGFKSNVRALLALGGVHLLGGIIVSALALILAGVSLDQLHAPVGSQPVLSEETQLRFMLIVILLAIPLTAALWFAPALIVFADATFVQAMVASTRACVSNWMAMIAYGVGMFLLVLITVSICAPFLFFFQTVAPTLLMFIGVPITAVLMISDYVSYRRVFHRDEKIERVTAI